MKLNQIYLLDNFINVYFSFKLRENAGFGILCLNSTMYRQYEYLYFIVFSLRNQIE